jgi:hypothetical protein
VHSALMHARRAKPGGEGYVRVHHDIRLYIQRVVLSLQLCTHNTLKLPGFMSQRVATERK